MPIANFTRSWLMLVPLIPSIAITVFDLYHYLRSRALRTTLSNHVVILLLFCGLIEQVTDIAWQAHFYRTGTSLIQAEVFCRLWAFAGGAAYTSVYTVMMWASMERHILIFHSHWLSNRTKRFFFHYLPLILTILWPLTFYTIAIFLLPCSAQVNYSRRFCGLYACVSVNSVTVGLIDSVGNFISTAFITVVFSASLLIRVVYHRYRVHQRIQWRNYQKLAVQLLPISSLYIVLQLPPMALYAAYSAGVSTSVGASYYSDGLFFTYWITQLTPFVAALSVPDWQTKFRNMFLFWRIRRSVAPLMLTATRPNGAQATALPPVAQAAFCQTNS